MRTMVAHGAPYTYYCFELKLEYKENREHTPVGDKSGENIGHE
jgi:hypothetical protein